MSFVLLFLVYANVHHTLHHFIRPCVIIHLLFDLHELFNDTTLMPKMLQKKKVSSIQNKDIIKHLVVLESIKIYVCTVNKQQGSETGIHCRKFGRLPLLPDYFLCINLQWYTTSLLCKLVSHLSCTAKTYISSILYHVCNQRISQHKSTQPIINRWWFGFYKFLVR